MRDERERQKRSADIYVTNRCVSLRAFLCLRHYVKATSVRLLTEGVQAFP